MAIYGDIVRYTCLNCGTIIELYEHTKDMFIENDVPYFCESCDEPINFKSVTQEDKEQECKKCGRVFGSVRCFDVDCPNNTPNYYKQHTKNNNI